MTNHSTQQTGASGGSGVALPVGLQLGHYRLLRKIGQGGFGITYLAEHIQSHEQVVIKENLPTFYAYRDKDSLHVYPLDDGSSAENYAHTLQRFVEEARTLARLNHPNIVRVLEAFEALGTAYYVMPYIEAKELHRVIPTEAVNEAWLLPILKAVLGALDYLHAKNLLHRDLKPGNILLQADGTPILIDFGTARALQTERSATMVGTPGYTPLEQITPNGNRGPWTDLYALGATCYRLITGELPPQSIERIDDDPYRPLAHRAELQGRFSPAFLHAIDTALAVRAKKRWQNAQEWAVALPTSAGPSLNRRSTPQPSLPTPTEKAEEAPPAQTGGKMPLVLIISLLTLLLLGGGGYGVYAYQNILEQRRIQAEYELAEAKRMAQEQAERLKREEEARRAREEAERLARAKEEAERLAREEAERKAKEKAKGIAQNELAAMGITDYDEGILEYYGNPEKLKQLIAAGADVNKADVNGWTPLCRVACTGHTECVKILLAVPGINANKVDKDGRPPLYWAAINNHTECVKLLLAAPNIDVNKAYKDGKTPLCRAAMDGHTECVKLLLAAPGIAINNVDEDGYTPLNRAAYWGNTEVVKLLLAAPGIDVNRANKDGKTPLQLATDRGHTECAALIRAAGGR